MQKQVHRDKQLRDCRCH